MDQITISQLPYRDNVSCVVFKNDKYLLVQQVGWPEEFWKFPQGGIETNETEEETVKRELREEVGIEKLRMIGKAKCTNQYDWAEEAVKLAGYRWRGQIQKFYFIEYLGKDSEIVLNTKEHQRYKWVNKTKLMASIDHNHKNFTNYKISIEKVLAEFNR